MLFPSYSRFTSSIFLGVTIYGHMGAHMTEGKIKKDRCIHLLKHNEGVSENMEPQNIVEYVYYIYIYNRAYHHPDAPCMEYLPTFTPKMAQM